MSAKVRERKEGTLRGGRGQNEGQDKWGFLDQFQQRVFCHSLRLGAPGAEQTGGEEDVERGGELGLGHV